MIDMFKPDQQFVVIINDVGFYSTAQNIRNGVGSLTLCNIALKNALQQLEQSRSGYDVEPEKTFFSGKLFGYDIHLEMIVL